MQLLSSRGPIKSLLAMFMLPPPAPMADVETKGSTTHFDVGHRPGRVLMRLSQLETLSDSFRTLTT